MKKLICCLLIFTIVITSSVMTFAKTKGDVNSDGNVNSSDALAILQYSVGSNPKSFNKNVADMNDDGNINSSDALIVLKISVGLINPDNESAVPSDTAEVLEYFNTAINRVKTDAKSVEQKSVTNYLAGKTTISGSIQSVYNMLGGDE